MALSSLKTYKSIILRHKGEAAYMWDNFKQIAQAVVEITTA